MLKRGWPTPPQGITIRSATVSRRGVNTGVRTKNPPDRYYKGGVIKRVTRFEVDKLHALAAECAVPLHFDLCPGLIHHRAAVAPPPPVLEPIPDRLIA